MIGDKSQLIEHICNALSEGDRKLAGDLAERDYPFTPRPEPTRTHTTYQSMFVFQRDGFIDRYSGARLVFPGALRLISQLLPDHFPWHPHGKLSQSHIVHWELYPTIDHVVPVTRGGADDESNWVTTSMLRNQAKGHWTLEELGWQLRPVGNLEAWDGLTGWCLDYVGQNPGALSNSHIKKWCNAARRAREASSPDS